MPLTKTISQRKHKLVVEPPDRLFNAQRSYRRYCGPGLCAAWVTVSVILWIFALSFGIVIEQSVQQVLEKSAYVCNRNYPFFYKLWKTNDPDEVPQPKSFLEAYFYNITDPLSFASGGDIEAVEIGPFVLNRHFERFNVSFIEGPAVRYNTHTELGYSSKRSCDSCEYTTELTIVSPYWARVITNAVSESSLFLGVLCDANNINLVLGNPAAPLCTTPTDRRNPAAGCRCCDINPAATFGVSCSSLVDPLINPLASLVSFNAKYEGGVRVSSDPTNIGPSTGVYSPTIVTVSPRQFFGGQASGVLGAVRGLAAQQTGDAEQLRGINDMTNRLYAACAARGKCPNIADTAAEVVASGDVLGTIGDLKCSGVVDQDDREAAFGSGDTYEYLDNMSCQRATTTWLTGVLASVSTLAGLDGGDVVTCSDPSDTVPCCMGLTASFPNLGLNSAAGLGCLFEVRGGQTTRDTSNRDEYLETNNEHFEMNTGCGDGQKSLVRHLREFRSQREFNVMYQPAGVSLPTTRYARPIDNVQASACPACTGTLYTEPVSGRFDGQIEPDYFQSASFFTWDPFPGSLRNETIAAWNTAHRRELRLAYTGVTRTRGLRVSRFTFDVDEKGTPTIANQRRGLGVPGRGLNSVQFADDVPFFVGLPNFYLADEEWLTQDDNSALDTMLDGSLSLKTLVRKYTQGKALRDSPVVIDADYVEDNSGSFEVEIFIEPASGKIVGGKGRFATHLASWFCDPADTAACQFGLQAPSSTPYCYITRATGFAGAFGLPAAAPGEFYSFGCSAYNVFTPGLLGGKIIPLTWSNERSGIDRVRAGRLSFLYTMRHAGHVFIVLAPFMILLFLAGACWYARCELHAREIGLAEDGTMVAASKTVTVDASEKKFDNVEDGTL